MKIVHFCTYSSGGAAKAAIRLHEGLCSQGIDSSIIFLYKNNSPVKNAFDFRDSLSTLQNILLKAKNKVQLGKQKKAITSIAPSPEYFSFPQTVWNVSQHPLIKNADVIHFHWMGTFLDYRSLSSENFNKKKIVWTLHDMHPFTGGFHYDNWFDTKPWNKIVQTNQQFINEHIASLNITLIAPSEWIKDYSMSKGGFRDKKHVRMANPSSASFFFVSKAEARKKLNLDLQERICFIPADDPDYERKGIMPLEKLIAKEKTNTTFLITGKRKLDLGTNKQVYLGEINSETTMNLCYNACDITVFPSLAENFSNTLVEAMLCGCPIICFDTGGNKEIINTPGSGLVLPLKAYEQMLHEVCSFSLSNEKRQSLAKNNSENAFSINKTIEKFINFYKE